MKKLLPLLLFLLLLAGCAETYDGPTEPSSVCSRAESIYYDRDGQISQQYLEEYAYDIHGNRSVIREYSISPITDEKDPTLKTVLRYDERGNVIRQTQYDVSGWFPRKICDNRYTYDDQGRMIRSTHTEEPDTVITYDDGANTRTTSCNGNTIVEYLNERGWVMSNDQTFSDGRHCRDEYERDPDGRLLSIRSYEGGVLSSELVYTYDDQGRSLTMTKIEDSVSTLLYGWEYGKDWERMFYSDGTCSTVVYHEDGTMKRQYHTDADGHLSWETFYYYTEIQVPAEEVSP